VNARPAASRPERVQGFLTDTSLPLDAVDDLVRHVAPPISDGVPA
jgi:hypothetical protein